MDRFIVLLKKKLLRNMTVDEEEEFHLILNENDDLRVIYHQCFSEKNSFSSYDEIEAEESFAVQFVKMQLKKGSK